MLDNENEYNTDVGGILILHVLIFVFNWYECNDVSHLGVRQMRLSIPFQAYKIFKVVI